MNGDLQAKSAVKTLVMQYRVERFARRTQYVGLTIIILFVVAAIGSEIWPVHLAWRDGP